ncbi:MAG: hypothetical protein WBA74_22265 [Cyclobacteriaceae bacterium]
MKKTILLLIIIPLAFFQQSKAQHFVTSFGVQQSWGVPRIITDQIYDHYFDFNWVHANRVLTPYGIDYHVILQRNNLFVEVELGWDGFIRNVEYFDYYPLDHHVCDDFCGFHRPFYTTYHYADPFRYNYGISYVYFRPRIRAVYYHPFRYTRRARFYDVYSPYRFRRNYTRVIHRSDRYDHSIRYGSKRHISRRSNGTRVQRDNYNRNNSDNGRSNRSNSRSSDADRSDRYNRNSQSRNNESGRSSRTSSDRYYNNSEGRTGKSSTSRRTTTSGNRSYTPRTNTGNSNKNYTTRSASESKQSTRVNRPASTSSRSSGNNRSSYSGSTRSRSYSTNSGSRSSGTVKRSSGNTTVKRSSSSRSASGNKSGRTSKSSSRRSGSSRNN